MNIPADRKYTKDHEWVVVAGDTATMGITEFAQEELGDVVFVDLPTTGKSLKQKEVACVVESTKAASDVYAPISGAVAETNGALTSAPDLINKDPYGSGWMVKFKGVAAEEVKTLLSADEYRALIKA